MSVGAGVVEERLARKRRKRKGKNRGPGGPPSRQSHPITVRADDPGRPGPGSVDAPDDMVAASRLILEGLVPQAPATEADFQEVAASLVDAFRDAAIPYPIADVLIERLGAERARAIGEAAATLPDAGPAAFELAGWIAMADDRHEEGEALLRRALEVAMEDEGDDPVRILTREALALRELKVDRPGAGLEVLIPAAAWDPDLPTVQTLVAHALERIWDRAESGPEDPCPCGSPEPYAACCHEADLLGLGWFFDDAPSAELQDAAGVRWELDVMRHVREQAREAWFDGIDPDLEDPDEMSLRHAMMQEWGWLVPSLSGDEDEPQDDDDLDTLLGSIATDRSVDPHLAYSALKATELARYGLWQVRDPLPSPGAWVIELVTGAEHYVVLPEEYEKGVPRWTAFLGPILPVDGAWRLGSALMLSPAQAEQLTEEILAITLRLLPDLLSADAPDSGRTLMRGVGKALRARSKRRPLVVHVEPMDEIPAFVASRAMGGAFPQLVDSVRRMRPRLANTDGHPLELHDATIRVPDIEAARRALLSGPDFRADEPEDGAIAWYGKEVPAPERAASLAELRAQGHEVLDADEPARYVRGVVRTQGELLRAEVNSRQRLEDLLALLADRCGPAEIVEDRVVDPELDLPMPGPVGMPSVGPRVSGADQDAYQEEWRKHWPDEHVPALRGLTPRAAAKGSMRPWLEMLLRDFEYREDRRAGAPFGGPGHIEALRADLGMEAPTEP